MLFWQGSNCMIGFWFSWINTLKKNCFSISGLDEEESRPIDLNILHKYEMWNQYRSSNRWNNLLFRSLLNISETKKWKRKYYAVPSSQFWATSWSEQTCRSMKQMWNVTMLLINPNLLAFLFGIVNFPYQYRRDKKWLAWFEPKNCNKIEHFRKRIRIKNAFIFKCDSGVFSFFNFSYLGRTLITIVSIIISQWTGDFKQTNITQ